MINTLKNITASKVDLSPLASFRIIFGLLMFFSVLRFWSKGWIYDLYIAPDFHFKYYGFEWVEVLPAWGMYTVFSLMMISALGICLGYFYRWAAAIFFLSFTYVELMDVANYLNHYYFVSLIAFLMIFLPANKRSSFDVKFGRVSSTEKHNWWSVNIIRIQLSLVYIFAGIAKLNSDWILEALPLKIWLPAHSNMPLIGEIFNYTATAFVFSWFGALYDLLIVFFLWKKSTRPWAYAAVIIFHLLTWILFPIGVFPWVMIFSTLIFFSSLFHQNLLDKLDFIFGRDVEFKPTPIARNQLKPGIIQLGLILFLGWQILWPLRFITYPGNILWTEQAYRLSWRVMLIEKAGYLIYHIKDPQTGEKGEIHPADYLTVNQVKQLSTQPDLILQFAHYLRDMYREKGIENAEISAESYVTLNGRGSRLFIDPKIDLSKEKEDFRHKPWILPYAN